MQANSPKSGVALGLNLSRDRSAYVVIDVKVRVPIAEEKLYRRKHDIPLDAYGENYCQCLLVAIKYCLATALAR